MYNSKNLKEFIQQKHCTLLGVGVMSKNCVDVTIELANYYKIPMMMIASRRQIEAKKFGGGYVNNWSTETFAKYVKEKDIGNNIILARDHGGLWQNNFEKEQMFTLHEAMESAKESFKTDIESGFDMIHIDTSVDIHEEIDVNESLSRIFYLYDYCNSVATTNNKDIIYEIGSEEQSENGNNKFDLGYTIVSIQKFCRINNLPQPTFIVVQTGTKVLEAENVGIFDKLYENTNIIPKNSEIPKLLEICNKNNIMMKQHNTDYLSDRSLRWHPKLGIHAANVAPEFAIAETLAFIKILRQYNLTDILDKFIELSYNSRKWEKWMKPITLTNKEQKATISGHYIFSDQRFLKLKYKAENKLKKYNINLDNELKIVIKNSILRYLKNFNII